MNLPTQSIKRTFNVHETPTAGSVETQLKKRLSPERFDKVQRFFDQYGTVEGLRRLKKTDLTLLINLSGDTVYHLPMTRRMMPP